MVCGRSITCIVRQWEVAVWRLCFNTPHTTTTRFISVRAALLLKSHKSTMIDSTCLLHITETRCSYKCETLLHNAPIIFFIFTFLKSSGTRPLSANFVLGSAKKKSGVGVSQDLTGSALNILRPLSPVSLASGSACSTRPMGRGRQAKTSWPANWLSPNLCSPTRPFALHVCINVIIPATDSQQRDKSSHADLMSRRLMNRC